MAADAVMVLITGVTCIARLAGIAVRARAAEAARFVYTFNVVQARVGRQALIDVFAAFVTLPTGVARAGGALAVAHAVAAYAHQTAFIHLAVVTAEEVRALAAVSVYPVRARAPVHARKARAIVDVGTAIVAGVARLTGAGIAIDAIGTVAPVLTGRVRAVVNIMLARGAVIAIRACAREAIDRIGTYACVSTWIQLAVIDIYFATASGVTGIAFTLKACEAIYARAVLTRIWVGAIRWIVVALLAVVAERAVA